MNRKFGNMNIQADTIVPYFYVSLNSFKYYGWSWDSIIVVIQLKQSIMEENVYSAISNGQLHPQTHVVMRSDIVRVTNEPGIDIPQSSKYPLSHKPMSNLFSQGITFL